MLANPFKPPNAASEFLRGESAQLARALGRGLLRYPAMDLSADNLKATQQEPLYKAAQLTPAIKPQSDLEVLSFDLEKGVAAVITGLAWGYVGNGFVDGSGTLFWRLVIDFRYWPQYAAVPQSFGSPEAPRPIVKGIPVGPGQNVKILYNIPVGSPIAVAGNTLIFAAVSGVKFPLR